MILFTVMKINFSNPYQNFQQVLFLGFILLPDCIITSYFLRIMYALIILFCNSTDIDRVNLDILFLQG